MRDHFPLSVPFAFSFHLSIVLFASAELSPEILRLATHVRVSELIVGPLFPQRGLMALVHPSLFSLIEIRPAQRTSPSANRTRLMLLLSITLHLRAHTHTVTFRITIVPLLPPTRVRQEVQAPSITPARRPIPIRPPWCHARSRGRRSRMRERRTIKLATRRSWHRLMLPSGLPFPR